MELPKEFTITSGGASVKIDVSKLDEGLIEKLLLHGIKQKVADAAAGALARICPEDEDRKAWGEANADAVNEERQSSMQAIVDNLLAGVWGVERSGGGTSDPLDKYRLQVVRSAMGANPKIKAAYDAIDPKDQAERRRFLLSIAQKNAAAVDPKAEELREIDRNKKKGLAGVDISM